MYTYWFNQRLYLFFRIQFKRLGGENKLQTFIADIIGVLLYMYMYCMSENRSAKYMFSGSSLNWMNITIVLCEVMSASCVSVFLTFRPRIYSCPYKTTCALASGVK